MKKGKISLLAYERVALHAKLGAILKHGNPQQILLVIMLLLALPPVRRRKGQKKKGQPKRLP